MSDVTLSTHTVPNTAGSMQRKYEGDDATLHYTMLHYATIHYATLHYATLHYKHIRVPNTSRARTGQDRNRRRSTMVTTDE